MKQSERSRDCLLRHFRKYPRLQIRDIFKYIYQSSKGCEHMVSSPDFLTEYIRREYDGPSAAGSELTEALDGAYSRVHLSYLNEGLDAETLGKLFFLSAKKEENGQENIEQKLDVARELVRHGELPFDIDEFDRAAEEWRSAGYPAVRHSEGFRENYKPSYRVISNRFVPFLPLLARIDKALKKGRVTLAVDGGSASGKSTLGEMLSEIYDCTVFHMDDFFLRPEQRTAERYAEVGGNVDRERFLEEVLIPHSRGSVVEYRPFDCSTFELCPPVAIAPKRLTIIEGAYSMHPELAIYYDLTALLDISPELQRKRIEKRNSPQMAERFFAEWIPLERVYFKEMQVRERCDVVVAIEE